MDIFSDCKCMHLLLFCTQVILERLGVGTCHTLVEQADAPVLLAGSASWILHYQLYSSL